MSVPVRLPSSNGTRAMTAMSVRLAVGKQFVFRRLVEDVVDHLHAVDEAGLERAQDVRRLPAVHADADGAHEPLALQIVDGALPAVVVGPGVAPDVELLQIDRLHAEVPRLFSVNSRM